MRTLTLFIGLVIALTSTPLVAKKDLVGQRQKRLEFAETQWQKPEKVTLNVHYRVPVIETIGYLAVNYDDPHKLNQLVTELRPVSRRVTALSGDTFEGRSFPPELETETAKLRSSMMSDVAAIYGKQAVSKLEAYLDQKYSHMRGIFGPLD